MMTDKNTVFRALLTLVLMLFLLGGCKNETSESDSAVQSVNEPDQGTQSDAQ
jgi:hypothetical protein